MLPRRVKLIVMMQPASGIQLLIVEAELVCARKDTVLLPVTLLTALRAQGVK